MEESKRINKNPSRSRINLKDIPPLDPPSIPTSLKGRTRMVDDNVGMQRFEKKSEIEARRSFSNIQIDPNSTRTRSVCTSQEKKFVPVPEEEEEVTKPKSKGPDESKSGSAKSVLHEICVSKHWKRPVYECCKVEGPCHMRLFTFKVVLEIRDSSGKTVLECFGDPKRNKKAAAEHAAEASLWFLQHTRQNQTKPHHFSQMK